MIFIAHELKRVCIFVENINTNIEIMNELNRLANSEFGMDYEQLGSGEKEWCRDEIENKA